MKLIFLLSLLLGLPARSFEQEHVSRAKKQKTGTIITILDGTSSTGKTSIMNELNKVPIVSKKPYNLILDCRHTPEELGQEVTELIGETNQQLSDWQLSIEKALESKKSGQFETHDRSGKPVILEWKMTKAQEPEYDKLIQEFEPIFVKAFAPLDIILLKEHPEIPLKATEDDPYKFFAPFFKDINSIDWRLVEEKTELFIHDFWLKENLSDDAKRKFSHSIFIFISAKDPETHKIRGFIIYRIDDNDSQGIVIFEPLAILPEEQRQGLGKLLISSIFKIIPEISQIVLVTENTNKVAIKTYEALGFIQSSTNLHTRSVTMKYKTKNSDILQKIKSELTEKPQFYKKM